VLNDRAIPNGVTRGSSRGKVWISDEVKTREGQGFRKAKVKEVGRELTAASAQQQQTDPLAPRPVALLLIRRINLR